LVGGWAGGWDRHRYVSTRYEQETRTPGRGWTARGGQRSGSDPAEELALVSRSRRELLLRAYRYQLRREDLEDCYSQATLELVAYTRKGRAFVDRSHLGNLLEQRFRSRVRDRRRALSGRSPMQAALEASMSLGGAGEEGVEIVDVRAELEKLVLLRDDLRLLKRLAGELPPDQRLVLACQLLPMSRRETCRALGWSSEKYRKVSQRARARLRGLLEREERLDPQRS
jgi:DNA-directed RNA polymerase specialized sigma24 family protein